MKFNWQQKFLNKRYYIIIKLQNTKQTNKQIV